MKMDELEDSEQIKKIVQDTQMLIRNCMEQHKKESKTKHLAIKKKKKTIELFKEKVAKLMQEKEKNEMIIKNSNQDKNEVEEDPEITRLRENIEAAIKEKKMYDERIMGIKADYLRIKNEMGGLNATQNLQNKYEKHIKPIKNSIFP